jgi:hypothetical protein
MFPYAVMDYLVLFQVTWQCKSCTTHITHMISYPCMEQLVSPQVTRIIKVLVAHITHMFVAGHCSTLMTVGWAWLGRNNGASCLRVCWVRGLWRTLSFPLHL